MKEYRCIICHRTVAEHLRDMEIVDHWYLGRSEYSDDE